MQAFPNLPPSLPGAGDFGVEMILTTTEPVAKLEAAAQEIVKKANFMKGKGCDNCNKSGYRGRMGIYELMAMTNTIREMTFKGDSTQAIRKVARKQGMRTLFEDGMIKAMKGQTTLEEVLRITQHDMAGAMQRQLATEKQGSA